MQYEAVMIRVLGLLDTSASARTFTVGRVSTWRWAVSAISFCIALAGLCLSPAQAQSRVMNAVFTPTPLQVDGHAEDAWSKTAPSDIAIYVNPRRTAQLGNSKVS